MLKRGNKDTINSKDKTIPKNIFDKTKSISPHKTKHHVWLIATISLAVIVILFLAFYTQIRVAVVGKAFGYQPISCGVLNKNQCLTQYSVLYLNRENNAHGYKDKGEAATKVLCCVGAGYRAECTAQDAGGRILYLNRNNNAHASIPENGGSPGGEYDIPICINIEGGKVDCKALPKGQNPPSGYSFVIGLNRQYNAHLYTDEEGYTGTGGYNIYCAKEIAAEEVPAPECEAGDIDPQGIQYCPDGTKSLWRECIDGQWTIQSQTCELPLLETICTDKLDNDADGLTDCQDNDCHGEHIGSYYIGEISHSADCEFGEELTCNDGFNNDGDASLLFEVVAPLTDCADPDCIGKDGCLNAQCNDEHPCQTGFTCYPPFQSGSCRHYCQDDQACLEGYVCENHACVPPPEEESCEATAQCPNGKICYTYENICVTLEETECRYDRDCSFYYDLEGYICENQVCVPAPEEVTCPSPDWSNVCCKLTDLQFSNFIIAQLNEATPHDDIQFSNFITAQLDEEALCE